MTAAHAQAPAKAAAPPQVAQQAARAVQRREDMAYAPLPLRSLSAIPGVQRKCAACEEENKLPVQPRLEVGPVGDRYEQEADSIAGRVMAMRTSDVAAAGAEATVARLSVQRACSACSSSKDDKIRPRRSPMANVLDEEKVQARSIGGEGGESIAASDAKLTGGGSELPASTRSFFEGRMGRDLSDVRVHRGGEASALNASIQARAFTYKNHIWLGSSETASPSFTMAHELAHVMQQTAPGPVGPAPQRVEISEAAAAVQREPFFMQGDKTKPTNAVMHNVAQGAVREVNPDLITEVPIPGASRTVVVPGKCGFADFYTASPLGSRIPVPGLEAVETAPNSGVMKVEELTKEKSKSTCVFTPAFDGAMRYKKDPYPLGPARGPNLDGSGNVVNADKGPQSIKVGELKPAHDVNYRGSGVTQLNNYISGINAASAETNNALAAQGSTERWSPSPSKWTDITLPSGWDAKGVSATTTWPVPDLKIRDYAAAPKLPKSKKKAKGSAPTTAKDVKSGAHIKISGRWMLAKDSTRIPGGDGVYVYFLAPNPEELTRALKSRRTSAEFRKLTRKLRAIYKPLTATPAIKKGPRKRPLEVSAAIPSLRRRSVVMPVTQARPRIQRDKVAVDKFDQKQWELLRSGAFGSEKKAGSLAELFATTPSEQLREETAELNGIAEWVRKPPETAKSVTYSKEGAIETDPVSQDFDTLRKSAFWSSSLAYHVGVFRKRFGQMFVKGYAAFQAMTAKIKSVFKSAKFTTGNSSSLGARAAKIVGKIFVQLGKVVLARTVDVIGECLKSGFASYMQKQVEGQVDELLIKAEQMKLDAEQIKEDVEAKIKSAIDSVIGGYEATIKSIAESAKMIGSIVSAVSEIIRIARMVFCASGLAAAGWGAIVTCLLSIADWIASKFDKSPLDWVIKKFMSSCRGRRILAEALMLNDDIRGLPTLLAKTILQPIKDNLPAPADEMICDIEALKVPDLSMADFECRDGEGDEDEEDDGDMEPGSGEKEGGGADDGNGSGGNGNGNGRGGGGRGGNGKKVAPGAGKGTGGNQPQGTQGGDTLKGENAGGGEGDGFAGPTYRNQMPGVTAAVGEPTRSRIVISGPVDPTNIYNGETATVSIKSWLDDGYPLEYGSATVRLYTPTDEKARESQIEFVLSEPLQVNYEYSPTGEPPFEKHWRRLKAEVRHKATIQ